jgi:hypothetical protein
MLGEIIQMKLSMFAKTPLSNEIQTQIKFMVTAALGVDTASLWISSFGYVIQLSNSLLNLLKG